MSVPLQPAPTYLFFEPSAFQQRVPAHFRMDPTRVVQYYQAPGQTSWVAPALLTGGAGALGGVLGGPLGGALGGAAGPLFYSLITPEEEAPREIAIQSGMGALGGGLGGVLAGPLGAGLGAGLGGFLGYQLSQR